LIGSTGDIPPIHQQIANGCDEVRLLDISERALEIT